MQLRDVFAAVESSSLGADQVISSMTYLNNGTIGG